MKKITRALSLTLAAATALSTCVCAYADNTTDADENKQVLATVKSRISVPKELSKFSFRKSVNGPVNLYTYEWENPDGGDTDLTVSAYGDIITYYQKSGYYRWNSDNTLAKMTGDQLYSAAVAYIKKLNPTISTLIRVDRDSIRMSLSDNTATFTFNRVKSGVPVTSDMGYITIDKNTGELYRMSMNWHPNASFKSKKGALTVEQAEKAYADLIAIKPVYVLKYDDATKKYYTDIEYDQTGFGNIDAFTGAVSDFEGDTWYDDNDITEDDDVADDSFDNGGDIFTPEELAELEKKLPYGNAEAVEKYIRGNKYLTWVDGFEVSYDSLSKDEKANDTVYIYNVSFNNVPETGYNRNDVYTYVSVSINAETGELYSYDCYSSSSDYSGVSQYDEAKAGKLADSILKSLSPKHYKDLGDGVTTISEYNRKYFGSNHQYIRTVNGVETEFDYASISFDKDMKLESYSINYTNVDFVSPDKILTEQQVLDKFYELSPMKLNYLVKLGKKKTASALIYSNDSYLRVNAFTGEPVYSWQYETSAENDLSGINNPSILSMAKTLDDNGIIISTKKFAQGDAVTLGDFERMMWCIRSYNYYTGDETNENYDENKLLTRGEAMKLFTSFMAGNSVAELKGIFKSPFSDISDSDPNVGYYAIAYAMGAVKGGTFNASSAYTYGELISLVYGRLAM